MPRTPQTPLEAALVAEVDAARRAWTSYLPPLGMSEMGYAFQLRQRRLRYFEALRDIRDHVIEHGDIETRGGTWTVEDGQASFRGHREAVA